MDIPRYSYKLIMEDRFPIILNWLYSGNKLSLFSIRMVVRVDTVSVHSIDTT